MKVKQLSVFLENKPGSLSHPCKVLASAGINIQTMTLADTAQFGILHLIVTDWEQARRVLEQAGCMVKVTDVLATEVEDRPGGLARVLEAIEESHLNVEYTYSFTFGRDDKAILIFAFEDPDTAIEKLREKGIEILRSVDLYRRRG